MEIRESRIDHERPYQQNMLDSTPAPDLSYQTVWNHTISSGEVLQVEHRKADNNFRYSIIQNGNSVKVKAYNIPEQYRRPKTIAELRSLLVAKAIRAVPLSNMEIKLWFDEDRMHGADLYGDSWMNFCNHVKELANPVVLEELGELFIQRSRQDYWDLSSDKISGWIENLTLSDETVSCINRLSEAIVSKACTLTTADLIRQFREDLQDKFYNVFPLNENLSTNLKLLYSIPEIRQLKSTDLVSLRLELAKEKTVMDTLWPKVEELLNEDQIGSANSYVESKFPEIVDLYSLLAELLEERQTEANGFINQYDDPLDKFVGKTLHLTDPANGTSFAGVILKATRPNALIFETENQTKVIITSDFQVKLKKKHTYELLPAIIKGYSGDKFEITRKNYREDPLIKPGFYHLAASKYHSRMVDTLGSEPHYEITLKGDVENCTIYAYFSGKHKKKGLFWEGVKKIIVETTDKEGKQIKTDYPVSHFQRNYFATTAYSIDETKSFSGISRQNVDKSIVIKDESYDQRIKSQRLANLNENEKSLIDCLIEDKDILNKLVDSQINNSMKNIDYEIVKDSSLGKKVELLADKFESYLQLKKTPAEVLFQLVTKANYARFIDKEQNLLVANTMDLMYRADEHVSEMGKKENILVIGETGSGKSTTICHLLGAPMQEFKNKFGDQVWKVKEKEDQYPIIGQALGNSETLYSRGYSSEKTKAMITDCAGFEDTRGPEYHLCANLSMDWTIKQSKRIDAIVLVIPIQSFGVGRGNPIISLMRTVSERFPNVLDVNHPDYRRLFILVTKRNQVKLDTVSGLPNKIREYLDEVNAGVEDMEKRAKNGEDLEEPLSHLQFKQSVWTCLNNMFNDYPVLKKTGLPGKETRATVLDIRKGAQRLQLLDQYQYHAKDSAKVKYCSPMDSVQMKRKFHDSILSSTHTWSNLIFKKYLKEMGSDIEEQIRKIKECQIKIDSQNKNLETNQLNLHEINHDLEKLKPVIQQINSGEVTLDSQLVNIEQIQSNGIEHAKNNIEEWKNQVNDKTTEIRQGRTQIATMEEALEHAKLERRLKEKDYKKHSQGLFKDVIWKKSYTFGEKVANGEVFKGAAERAFEDVRALEKKDFIPSTLSTFVAGKYKGKLRHLPKIDKSYRLIPRSAANQKIFEEKGVADNYKAYIDSKNFTFLGRKGAPNGNRVVYLFESIWKRGNDLPEVTVVHEMPKLDYFEAYLINLNNDVDELNKKIIELQGKIDQEKNLVEKEEVNLKNLQSKLMQEEEILNQERELTFTYIENLVLEMEEKKAKLNSEMVTIERLLRDLENERKELESKHQQMVAEKKRYAAVIYDQLKMGPLINKFVELVCSGNEKKSHADADSLKAKNDFKSKVVESCEKFYQNYKQHFESLKQECFKDLSLQ